MRHNQNRRSRSRNRKGPNPLTRSYESNGPDVKVRGTAAHVAEKYMTLARDAQSSGDIVAAENYLQHAEHYNRIVMAAQAQFQQERQAQFGGAEIGYDDDRGVNGSGPVDRFGFNVEPDDDEEPDRFDSTEEEQERTQPRPPPQQQMRPDDRQQQPRGPRNDRYDNRRDRPDQRNDQRPDNRNEFRAEQRPDNRPDNRNDQRGDRGPRPDRGGFNGEANGERYGRGERFDRSEPRNDRPERPERDDRPGRGDRPERNDRPEPVERMEGVDRTEFVEAVPGAARSLPDQEYSSRASGDLDDGDVPRGTLGAGAETGDEAAAAPRRRRGRPPRSESVADPAAPDATPDGAAALAAFPE